MTKKLQRQLDQARDTLTGLSWYGYKPARVRKWSQHVELASHNLKHYGPTDTHCDIAADLVADVHSFAARSPFADLLAQPLGLQAIDLLQ